MDGAIHRAAGPELQAWLNTHHAGCPTGEGRISPAVALPALWLVHCVGPVWRGGTAGEAKQLAAGYRNAMTAARYVGARSIAFPAISTGVYGFPADEAARVAVAALRAALADGPWPGLREVTLVGFDPSAASARNAACSDQP